VRGTPLELVERFAIAGSLQEHPDDAACQTTIFASGERRIERGQQVQADHLRPAALLGDAPALFRRALLGYPLNW
jgi:hypothetical protein